jgi:hypothetical protein
VKRKGIGGRKQEIERQAVGSMWIGIGMSLSPPPEFFVSVASKGLSDAVSLLFATLVGKFISVASKGLTKADCWR